MAPFPLFRWAAATGILAWTAAGTAPHSVGGWFTAHLPWLIVAGVLTVAPEVVRFEFGGLKMEMLREAREEVKTLGDQVRLLQLQQASASATTTITQHFSEAAAVAGVAADITRGEETRAVPAQSIDWSEYLRVASQHLAAPATGAMLSADSAPESTVEQ